MAPKEKAEALVDSFMNIKSMKLSDYSMIYYPTAKQCALIAVHECIDLHHNLDGDRNGIGDSYKYWLEVKQEIENL